MNGVPVRIEIGPRDIENGVAAIMRRDTLEKQTYPLESLAESVTALLQQVQKEMLVKSKTMRDERIVKCYSLEEIKVAVDNGNFALVAWDGVRESEDKVKEYCQATARVMQEGALISETCAISGNKAVTNVIFAKAY